MSSRLILFAVTYIWIHEQYSKDPCPCSFYSHSMPFFASCKGHACTSLQKRVAAFVLVLVSRTKSVCGCMNGRPQLGFSLWRTGKKPCLAFEKERLAQEKRSRGHLTRLLRREQVGQRGQFGLPVEGVPARRPLPSVQQS